ncbi:MAG: acyl-CoA ligase (AMP-forming), exosortase A system-associated [Hyphomicrobiales bacterium]|nr:acyl-CoA ligase (AMP-forming), exosortase A system-associated [Hyphomicrobiales bacterium]
MSELLHDLIRLGAARDPGHAALVGGKGAARTYAQLWAEVDAVARGLSGGHLHRGERVAVYLDKRIETVSACFGAAAAGGVFVPLNPLLRARQVGYILRDCNVRVLVTSKDRYAGLAEELGECPDLRAVVLVDGPDGAGRALGEPDVVSWDDLLAAADPARPPHRVIDTDMVAILYTSGSTGMPKGVVLSHRNMVAGARSVSQYLENDADDVILSVLPLSFDAGFSQLTTAFHVGAKVVLMNYLLARDVVRKCAAEGVTGLTCVPPLWIQLSQQDWPAEAAGKMRYFANTGGHMPRPTLDRLRGHFVNARPYLMYGLTEAFRSTFLDPAEVDRRPDSIGKAIPNAEILVVRPDGTPCQPGEQGELVHRGALVSLGYWNDPERTAQRFKPAPGQPEGIVNPELAVFSGDLVRTDEEGFLYFVSRNDEMIKTSGYRVSPTEVEDVIYASGLAGECVALGIPHPVLGQGIVVVATAPEGGGLDPEALLTHCKQQMPQYMVPTVIVPRDAIPRSPNGKMDRKALAAEQADRFKDLPA